MSIWADLCLINNAIVSFFPRLETSANVQTTEIVYAAGNTQTTETRSIGVCYWDFIWIPKFWKI